MNKAADLEQFIEAKTVVNTPTVYENHQNLSNFEGHEQSNISSSIMAQLNGS